MLNLKFLYLAQLIGYNYGDIAIANITFLNTRCKCKDNFQK